MQPRSSHDLDALDEADLVHCDEPRAPREAETHRAFRASTYAEAERRRQRNKAGGGGCGVVASRAGVVFRPLKRGHGRAAASAEGAHQGGGDVAPSKGGKKKKRVALARTSPQARTRGDTVRTDSGSGGDGVRDRDGHGDGPNSVECAEEGGQNTWEEAAVRHFASNELPLPVALPPLTRTRSWVVERSRADSSEERGGYQQAERSKSPSVNSRKADNNERRRAEDCDETLAV